MKKKQMVSEMAKRTGMTVKESQKFIDTFVDFIKEALIEGEKISFESFLSMELVEAKERNARNPQTGENMIIPQKLKCKVKISNVFKDDMNK
jgi:nucleoid DNA-binding protein